MNASFQQTKQSPALLRELGLMDKELQEKKVLSRKSIKPQKRELESDCLKKLRQYYGKNDKRYGKTYSIKYIAEMLDLSPSYLKKLVGKQELISRDTLIAICILMRTDIEDANKLLKHYQYSDLDDNDSRDALIRGCMERDAKNEVSVNQVSDLLFKHGFKRLQLNKRNGKDDSSKTLNPNYIIHETNISSYTDIYDQYNSLSTKYAPTYECMGEMFIEDIKRDCYFVLIASTRERYQYMKYPDDTLPTTFKSLDATGDFKSLFIRLRGQLLEEKKKLEAVLNDTKNYGKRISANYRDGSIVVFAETFNFLVPEWNEYYLMELKHGQCRLSVYEKSMFMKYYLSLDDYNKYYRSENDEPLETYCSLEEIKEKRGPMRIRAKYRRRAFCQLEEDVKDCLDQIRKGKLFIRNLNYIYEPCELDNVCDYYHVLDDFECAYDDDLGAYRARKREAVLSYDGLGEVTISMEELQRAFELGYPTIQEICRIKEDKGSVEIILK